MATDSELFIIYEIGMIVILATLASKVCEKIKLPGLIGALFVGLFLGGPGGIGLFHESDELYLFGKFGAILLLFMSGIQFDAEKFFSVGRRVFIPTTLGVALAIISGYGLGILIGWSQSASLLLGVMISFSGTSVISAILLQKKLIQTEEGSTIMTAAIMDDVIGIIVFSTTLSSLGGESTATIEVLYNILIAVLFVIGGIYFGHRFLSKTMQKLTNRFESDEIFLIFIGFGLVIAFIASEYFGLSELTGAFIVGAILPQNKLTKEFGTKFNLMKDVFVALFFTGIGIMINPFNIGSIIFIALLILIIALFSRFIGTLLGGWLSKLEKSTTLGAAIGLGLRGELSLIIAQEAIAKDLVDDSFLTISFIVLIGTIIISIPIFNYWLKELGKKVIKT